MRKIVIGYTHDGLPVLESEVPKDAEQYIAKGPRQLDIGVTLQKGLKVNVLNDKHIRTFYTRYCLHNFT